MVLSIRDELYIPWPNRSGSAVQVALYFLPEVSSVEMQGGITVAREQVRARIGFLLTKLIDESLLLSSFLLPLLVMVKTGLQTIAVYIDLRQMLSTTDRAI